MNHQLHYGIVIQSYMPYKHKCTLIDRRLGMIECVFGKQPMMQRVHHGMFIEYSLVEQGAGKGSLYCLENVTIIATPAAWVTDDLVFMHHFLEMVRHFVEYGQQSARLYDILMVLYKEVPLPYQQHRQQHVFKKWVLCRFFFTLGIYPETHDSFDSLFFNLISSPVDIMVKMQQDGTLKEEEFSRWLLGCIAYHPQCDLLKTVFFLTRMDSHEL